MSSTARDKWCEVLSRHYFETDAGTLHVDIVWHGNPHSIVIYTPGGRCFARRRGIHLTEEAEGNIKARRLCAEAARRELARKPENWRQLDVDMNMKGPCDSE